MSMKCVHYVTLLKKLLNFGINYSGEGRIRTHGSFHFGSFQDCCLKPLGHLSNMRFNESRSPVYELYVVFLLPEKQDLDWKAHLIFVFPLMSLA